MQILSLIYNMDSSQSPLDDPSPDTSPHVPATPPPFFAHQAGDYEQSTGFYSAGPPAFLVHDHDEDEDEDTSGENVGFASLENSNLDYTGTIGITLPRHLNIIPLFSTKKNRNSQLT
jgi:hypothetical protein